jgi:hypothetical protein
MKKPTQPSLLADKTEARDYRKQYSSYKKELLEVLKAESGLSDPKDVVIYLAESYHPILRIKQKVGAKTRWGDFLNCAVAVEIDLLRNELSTRKSALESLVDKSPWRKLVINSKDPYGLFDKADKAGHKSKFYQILKQAYLYSAKINDLASYQKTVDSLINDAIKKN